MSHETLQALYALDVAEVGEKEAAKRWEFWRGDAWVECFQTIKWNSVVLYRRKPDLPWPKVMMQDTKEWPADAPEWANYMASDSNGETFYYQHKPLQADRCWETDGRAEEFAYGTTNWRDSLIERPKPAVKKIDWSNLPLSVRKLMVIDERTEKYEGTSGWIAWNCDENTRGNPLPDGLEMEWYYNGGDILHSTATQEADPNWNVVRCFRIVGIQEGWE